MAARLRRFSVLIPLLMLPLGLWLGWRTFSAAGWDGVVGSLAAIAGLDIGLAFLCAAASYLCLTGFDALALRHVGRPLAYRRVALTSFVALSIGHNVGVAALSSGTLRWRFYSGWGVGAVEVGQVILFCGVTVALGLVSLGGGALLLRPDLGRMIGMPPGAAAAVGGLCLAAAAAYVLLAWRLRRPLHIRGYDFRLPTVGIAAAQVALGAVNFAFVAATLYQLLGRGAAYADVVGAYVLGNLAGLVSHVPGGLGVLEYVVGALLSQGDVAGALILFRVVYFLVPLLLGSTLLAAAELHRWRSR